LTSIASDTRLRMLPTGMGKLGDTQQWLLRGGTLGASSQRTRRQAVVAPTGSTGVETRRLSGCGRAKRLQRSSRRRGRAPKCLSHKRVLRFHHGWSIRIDLLPKLVARIRQGARHFFIRSPWTTAAEQMLCDTARANVEKRAARWEGRPVCDLHRGKAAIRTAACAVTSESRSPGGNEGLPATGPCKRSYGEPACFPYSQKARRSRDRRVDGSGSCMSSQSGTLVMTRWPAALTAEGSVWTISDLQVLGNARSGAEQDAGQVGPQLILREPEDWIDRHLNCSIVPPADRCTY
jgi:hypothetical protein